MTDPEGRIQPRHAWSEKDRFVPRSFVRPFQRFMDLEASGGVILLIGAVVALVWANSPWGDTYRDLWNTPLEVTLGSHLLHIELTLVEWINDGLMVLFFFVVGLEIKRELVVGELRDPRAVALPAVAALGGMITPAAIYLIFNAGTDTANGWGVPMATDIAFAVGLVALVGDRIPSGARLFLLTLAIADDIGAIIVIAVFYTSQLSLGWLAGAVAVVAFTEVTKRLDIRSLPVYLVAGAVCWFCLHESGVHSTLAGVAFGLLTPVFSFHNPQRFGPHARSLVAEVDASVDDETITEREMDVNNDAIRNLQRLAYETMSPLERIEHKLSPWVAFVIVPLFALANAGVEITGEALSGLLDNRVALGILVGLVVGKTLGVFVFSFVITKLGVGSLPANTTWRHIFGLSTTAGVGFTVALFVATLAFDDPANVDDAKIGILLGSMIAGGLGYLLLRSSKPVTERHEPLEDLPVATTRPASVTDPDR